MQLALLTCSGERCPVTSFQEEEDSKIIPLLALNGLSMASSAVKKDHP